ncbi:MAG TPA: FKBP-type peptidyl-prolyl cis-trans isomerase [Tepidisphaeraceae bacterium]|jgi:hypothetical protein|nr:FKBP-type peptidyl-prolyl cis-trans isomerase [Tepidisphaeraceae bacterium]
MKKPTARRSNRPVFLEPLENRTLLSAAPGEVMHADVVTPVSHTTLHVSRHTVKLGQSIVFTAHVSALKKFGTVAGSIEFLNNGNPIQGTEGALQITLDAHNRASYDFAAGNVALFVGRQSFSAEFISTSTVPNSTSKSTIVNVTVPKLKTASDGLETATVHPGHGKEIKSGQTATVSYTGFLASSGQIFDYATADHGAGSTPTFQFTIGSSPVIQGFNDGTIGMRVGETRVLAIPSALGYGANGSESIPANSDLVFLLTLDGISAATT